MPEKPAALVRHLRRAQVPSRAGHRDVVDSFEREPQKLMDVSGDHVLHTITACNTVQGKTRIPQGHAHQPGRPVREDHLHRLRFVRLQIFFQERQLLRRELVGPALVQDRDVRRTAIEAVMPRMSGVLAEQALRGLRPDVVIAGREIQRKSAVWFEDAFHFLPLRLCRSVMHPLDRVAHGYYEGRIFCGYFLPDLFIDVRLDVAGAVAEDREAKRLRLRRRGASEQQQPQRGDGKERHSARAKNRAHLFLAYRVSAYLGGFATSRKESRRTPRPAILEDRTMP